MLSHLQRYQKGIYFGLMYPSRQGVCACGCNAPLTGKQKKWSSKECNEKAYKSFAILKGNTGAIRKALYEIDKGFCRSCGVYDEKWQADHIIPVQKGGGACGIDNFQTLCMFCHNEKTQNQMESHRANISSQESCN